MPKYASTSILMLSTLSLALSVSGCEDKVENKPAAAADASKAPAADKKPAADKPEDDKANADAKAVDAKPDGSKPEADAKTPPGDAAPEADAATDKVADAAAPPAAAADAGAAGPAYFVVRDRGLVELDGGKFTVVANSPKLLLRDLHVAADGKLYLVGSKGIMQVDGAKANMVAETSYKTTGSVDSFAVTKDSSTIWAVGYKGISKWADGKWSTEEKTVLGDDITLIKGVVVDANERVWVASSNKIHTLEGDKWVDVDVSKQFKRKPFFSELLRGPEGVTFAVASSTLLKLDKVDSVNAVDLKTSGFLQLGNLSFSANGNMAITTSMKDVVFANENKSWKAGADFASARIRGLGIDGQGRVWVASDIGVAILKGDTKTEWNSGSVLEIAGQIEDILVLGAGPELPEVGEVKKGGIKGKILTDGKGVAETEVEMCPSPNMMFKKSPCADSPVNFSGKTDADGNFAFAEVPIGAYGVSVKVGDKWQLTMSSNFGQKMKEGETYDIGAIKVKSKK